MVKRFFIILPDGTLFMPLKSCYSSMNINSNYQKIILLSLGFFILLMVMAVFHENGILIPPKNSNALFNAMLEMVHTDRLQRWGQNSSKLALKFDIHEVNQKTLSVYGVSA